MTDELIRVPDIGGAEGAEVVEVLVAPGEAIDVEQSLIVVESDKASMEIPAPRAGVVGELRVAVGDMVSEGDVILMIAAQGAVDGEGATATESAVGSAAESAVELSAEIAETDSDQANHERRYKGRACGRRVCPRNVCRCDWIDRRGYPGPRQRSGCGSRRVAGRGGRRRGRGRFAGSAGIG